MQTIEYTALLSQKSKWGLTVVTPPLLVIGCYHLKFTIYGQ